MNEPKDASVEILSYFQNPLGPVRVSSSVTHDSVQQFIHRKLDLITIADWDGSDSG